MTGMDDLIAFVRARLDDAMRQMPMKASTGWVQLAPLVLGGNALRRLAASWAGHPDHRNEWRPGQPD